MPLDEERASPSRPRRGPNNAPPATSFLSIQHDPSMILELEAYRQCYQRQSQAGQATRIKSALPEWQIVNMCVQ